MCQETGRWQAGCRLVQLCVLEPLLGLEPELAKASPPQGRDYRESRAQTLGWHAASSPGSLHLFWGEEGHGRQWRPPTYPSHVTDAEYSVNDVLVNVCRDELHLDGPVAPGGLLRPVLHTELGQGKKSQEGWGGVGLICH